MPLVPGNYAVADWVAMDCLRILTNLLAVAGNFNFTYQEEFNKSFAVGDTVRVKFPQQFTVTEGFAYNPQAINRQTTTVTVDNPLQIGFGWDSQERALFLERSESEIRANYNEPAMIRMANEYEVRAMDFAFFNTNNVVGSLASVPTTWDTYGQAMQRIIENAGWYLRDTHVMAVTPAMARSLIANSVTQFNPAGQISQQYRTGFMGRDGAAGFEEWYTSTACRQHTTGLWTDYGANVVETDGANQAGSSILLSATTGDTVKRGDIVNIEGVYNVNPVTKRATATLKQFKITADATAAASAMTISIDPPIIGPGSQYQNVSALPGDNADVTLWPGTTMVNAAAKTGMLALGFTKAMPFAMAGIKLDMPNEGGPVEIARQKRDPETGISIALIRQFDPELRSWINRFDTLFGFGKLYADNCAVLVASSQ